MAPKSTPVRAAPSPATAAEFRRRLLRWFRGHGRDLPWRRTRNPYHVLVSEFMLQQTQVDRVEAYYHRFLARYRGSHIITDFIPYQLVNTVALCKSFGLIVFMLPNPLGQIRRYPDI